MAKILHLETSTNVCSVALSDGEKLVAYRESSEDKSHATKLTVFVEEVLKETNLEANQLDAVSISKGPGSYTGLRIGVSAAKGICFGADLPLVSIETLKMMAMGMSQKLDEVLPNENKEELILCPMIDARRMEVYAAMFDTNLNEVQNTQALIIDENSFAELFEKKRVVFFGNGAEKLKDTLTHENAIFIDGEYPKASNMIHLALDLLKQDKTEDVAYFEPYYLKEFVATTSKKDMLKK